MRKTAAETQKTKTAIMTAAIRVFSRCGFERASLDAIGSEAGLTRGAIYWHFKDKHDLFAQVLKLENDRLDRLVESALAGLAPAFVKLRRLLDAVVDNFYDHETFRQFIEFTWYKLDPAHIAPVMEEKEAFVQNFLSLMRDLLGEAQRTGDVAPGVDIHLTALHLSCLINGLYRLYHVAPAWARDKNMAMRLFADLLDSVAGRTEPHQEKP
jgi:TetR/AcrR family transcriptional regulator, acrAB operon repressor